VSYADDMCFCLDETTEWGEMHFAAGLPKKCSNRAIKEHVNNKLSKMGWKWSAFTNPEWLPCSNKEGGDS